jgi:signal transduction histidine kinase
VSARTGFDITLVRVGFVLASLASGFGILAYLIGWLLLPPAGDGEAIINRAVHDRRGITLAAGVATALGVLLIAVDVVGVRWLGTLGWPVVVGSAGAVLVWRNASPREQATLRRLVEPVASTAGGSGRRRLLLRLTTALLLVLGGLAALILGHPDRAVLRPLSGIVLVVAGLVVVFAPLWLRVARELVLERQARARAEERAELASHLHDSVLQTLALIQRQADSPQRVVSLARAQERQLRSWLFGESRTQPDAEPASFAEGVRRIQHDVEAQHGVPVEIVVVGDCAVDERVEAMLAAAREATVNAAKWSEADVVSIFSEVDGDSAAIYVRDRGRGFDPDLVPSDRQGLAGSIHDRMRRHRGEVALRTAPGEGTEVSLRMHLGRDRAGSPT